MNKIKDWTPTKVFLGTVLFFTILLIIWAPWAEGAYPPTDTIHITQTTGQYDITTGARVYILDNNLTSDTSAFSVSSTVNNIVLELNGKIVTFGNNATKKHRYGVYMPQGVDTVVIRNGSIIQGTASDSCKVIYAGEANRNIEIGNIKIKFRGMDSDGIYLNEPRGVYIHDDSIEAALDSISNRQHPCYAILITAVRDSVVIKDNTIYTTDADIDSNWGGQSGIWVDSRKYLSIGRAEISGNQVHLNGLCVNSFQITVTGFSYEQQGTRLLIFNNRLTTPEGGSNRGLMLEGIWGDTTIGVDGARIYNNYINVHEHAYPPEYTIGWTNGIKMRGHESDPTLNKHFSNEFYNDTIIATAYYNTVDDEGDANAIWLDLGAPIPAGKENVFHDNLITATTSDSRVRASIITLEQHNAGAGTIFRNNTFTCNSDMIFWNHVKAESVIFKSNQFNIAPDSANFYTIYFRNFSEGADPPNPALGHIFLDNTLGAGVSYKNIYLSSTEPDPRSFWVQWYLNVNVKDSLGQNISDAIVKGYDKNNTLRFTDTTNASGNAQLNLSEFYFYSDSGTTDTNYIYFNDYKAIATKSGVADTVLNITMDSTQSLNMILGEAAGSFTTNYTLIEDAGIRAGGALQNNYGATQAIQLGYSWATFNIIYRVLNIADSLPVGALVDSAYFSIYMSADLLDSGDSIIVRWYKLLKNWGEGVGDGVLATTGECSGDSNIVGTSAWTTDAAEGSGTDRSATNETDGVHPDSLKFVDPPTVGYYKLWLTPATVEGWRTTNYGMVLRTTLYSDDDDRIYISSAEYTNQPSFTCYYTVGGGETPPIGKRWLIRK